MQDAFASPAFIGSHRVCGYALQPLSAAHLLAIEGLNIGVYPHGEIKAQTLIYVCKILRQKPRGIGLLTPKKLSILDQIKCGLLIGSAKYREKNIKSFVSYWREFSERPSRCQTDSEGRGITSPAVWGSVVQAVRMGIDIDAAWSMPYNRLAVYVDVFAESEGAKISFEADEYELELMAKAQEKSNEYGEKNKEELLKKLKPKNV